LPETSFRLWLVTLRVPYGSLRVTLRVRPQKNPCFTRDLTALRVQTPGRYISLAPMPFSGTDERLRVPNNWQKYTTNLPIPSGWFSSIWLRLRRAVHPRGRRTKFFKGRGVAPRRPDGAARRPRIGAERQLCPTRQAKISVVRPPRPQCPFLILHHGLHRLMLARGAVRNN
jgi:hypothetical protein